MAARTGILVLTGGVLLGIGAAAFVRKPPGAERPSRPSPPPPVLRQPPPALPEEPVDAVELDPAPDPPPYGTALITSTATRRHWRVDPREVRDVEERRRAGFPGLILAANFGGGVRVEHPGDVRLGVTRDLEKGDVVRDLNGFPVGDEDQFQLLATRLWKKTGVIRATIDRGGSSIRITYQRADAPLPPPSTFR